MNIKFKHLFFVALSIIVVMNNSCSKKKGCTDPNSANYDPDAEKDDGSCIPKISETPTTSQNIPKTYNFTNVNYGGQAARLSMLDEIGNYMKEANTQGTALDAQKLKNMFQNQNSPFVDINLNTSGKNLKGKCFSFDQAIFEAYFDSIAIVSSSTVAGSNGTPGVVVSSENTSKAYLLSASGISYRDLILKHMMGAVFYYQATGVYLTEDKIGAAVDNSTVVSGEGTAMEHHWDEAFGYFGVPVDFPTNKTGLKYWGNYSNQVDAPTGLNTILMDAFIKGRYFISAKDMTAKDTQVNILSSNWEKVVAASAIHELNEAKTVFADDAVRCHLISEAMGFVLSLKYNPNKKISQPSIDMVMTYLGENLYTVSLTDINNAIALLSSTYEFDSIKSEL